MSSVLNVQDAANFALFSDIFYTYFDPSYGGSILQINSIYNNAGVVNNFYNANYSSTGAYVNQTLGNEQGMRAVYDSILAGNTISSPGNGNYGALGSVTMLNGQSSVNPWPLNFTQLPNTSQITLIPFGGSLSLSSTGAAYVDLKASTNLGAENTVASSSNITQFIPGVTQSFTLSYAYGSTITNTITNGVTNTTQSTSTTTTTVGIQVTGESPFVKAQFSASASQAWQYQSSKTISYSNADATATTSTTTLSATVNLGSATANSDGTYSWKNSSGKTFTLTPGSDYIAQIEIENQSFASNMTCYFNIQTPQNQPMTLGLYGGYYTGPDYNLNQSPSASYTEQQVILANNNTWNYQLISNVDPSLFSFTAGASGQVLGNFYKGLITSNTSVGTTVQEVIRPIASTSDAAVAVLTTGLNGSDLASSADAIAAATSFGQNGSVATTPTTTNLDMKVAANKYKSSYGVSFDNTATENSIKTANVNISGDNHDVVKLGNLNYSLANFSNSIVKAGNGNNIITLASADTNNSFTVGNGNNYVSLNGDGNTIHLGDGNNFIIVNTAHGTNYITAGKGPTQLTINSATGFTQVSNWDNTQDYLNFGAGIKLSDIVVSFNNTNWSYNVYDKGVLIANLMTAGGLSHANSDSSVSQSYYASPLPVYIKSNAGFVNALYDTTLGHAPDAAGLNFWTQALSSGHTRAQVIKSFLTSPEFTSHYATNSEYVAAVYQDVLGRAVDAGAQKYWPTALTSGSITKAEFVADVLASSEYVHLVGTNTTGVSNVGV